MAEEIKTARSIRANESTFDKLKAITEEEGFENQGAALEALISAFEIGKSKAILPNLQTDISDYESHITAIQKAFLHTLELNVNAENRIRAEFLQRIDADAKTIADYQVRIETLEQTLKETEDKCSVSLEDAGEKLANALRDVSEANDKNLHLTDELNAAKATVQDKLAIIDGLTARVPAIEELQAELKEKDAEISNLKSQNVVDKNELISKISELNNTIRSLSSENEKLKTSAELAEQKHQLALERAVVDEQKKATEEEKKSADELKRLYAEIDDLRKQLFELKNM